MNIPLCLRQPDTRELDRVPVWDIAAGRGRKEESPGESGDLLRCQVFPMGLYRYREASHSPRDRCCGSDNFEQHSRRVLCKGGIGGIARIIWRMVFPVLRQF